MLVTIKNLQQQSFTIELEATQTVLELKEQIFKEQGEEYDVAKQKLIYAGVILEDDRAIESYNIDEKKFLVLMLKKNITNMNTPTALPLSQLATVDDNTEAEEEAEEEEIQLESEAETEEYEDEEDEYEEDAEEYDASEEEYSLGASANVCTEVPLVPIANTLLATAGSNLLMGDDYVRSIKSIMEMGYARDLVERAMIASFNNPERAVEYLISGIPENGNEAIATPEITEENLVTALNNTSISTPQANDPFEFLRNQPQFLQIRAIINSNPDLLQPVLQQIGQTNPGLLQLISENQEAFLAMLNQPIENEISNDLCQNTIDENMNGAIGQNPSAMENNNLPVQLRPVVEENAANNTRSSDTGISIDGDGITTIRISAEDRDAINRLKALGFPETLVLQAYFACDKNEELAANFLIVSTFDD